MKSVLERTAKPEPLPALPPVRRMHFVMVRVMEHWFVPIKPGTEAGQAVFTDYEEAQRCVDLLKAHYSEKAYRNVVIVIA